MRKTSFFYRKKRKKRISQINRWLEIVLIWMLVINQAVFVNLPRREETDSATEACTDVSEGNIVNESNYTGDPAIDMREKGTGKIEGSETEKITESKTESITEKIIENVTESITENMTDDTTDNTTDNTEENQEDILIRVLLMNSGFQSYYHTKVEFTVKGKSYSFSEESEVEADMLFEGGEEGIAVSSICRQEGIPVYKGTLEIKKEPEGFLLINTLPLETYLEGVVPSEMPSFYQKEALKAQAICARTYACRQMEDERLEKYGADVDDSTSYQVYNNINQKESTTAAVRETRGQVLCQDGELIEAYYFSTSAGVTSTDEVWGALEAAPYLQSVLCPFDAEEPWGSWSVEIPWNLLQERAQAFASCSGTLSSLEITRKSQSGAVTGVMVNTEAGSFLLENEYEVRQFFGPVGLEITEKNTETTKGGVLLPSAYFSMETTPGVSVSIQGKGYGHGVGMSQNGANQMAKEGYTCEEILDYFFKEIEIVNLYDR